METTELVSITTSLSLLVLYHIKLYVVVGVSKDPHSQLYRIIQNVSHWIQKHKENGDPISVTLAIQTLRNTIMVAVFVGGNAFVYGYQAMTEYTAHDGNPLMQCRSIIIAASLICSFLCWVCVIRFASHAGYTLGTLSYEEEKLRLQSPTSPMRRSYRSVSENIMSVVDDFPDGNETESYYLKNLREFEEDIHQKSRLIMVFFSLGFRFIFVALPFLFLSAGALALVISTIIMLTFLYFYDY